MSAAAVIAGATRFVGGTVVQWRCDATATSQRIYFANHSSHLDFVSIWSALPPGLRARTRPVAGRDYWGRNAVRAWLAGRVFHAVLIDRREPEAADPRAAAQMAVQHMADGMGDGCSLIVFPEGTRSANGEIGPFKSGLYHLSQLRPHAELIPVHLENLNRILPKGEALPVPMLSRVVFGPPFEAKPDKEAFLAAARNALLQLKVGS